MHITCYQIRWRQIGKANMHQRVIRDTGTRARSALHDRYPWRFPRCGERCHQVVPSRLPEELEVFLQPCFLTSFTNYCDSSSVNLPGFDIYRCEILRFGLICQNSRQVHGTKDGRASKRRAERLDQRYLETCGTADRLFANELTDLRPHGVDVHCACLKSRLIQLR